jgi:hypothetical protein
MAIAATFFAAATFSGAGNRDEYELKKFKYLMEWALPGDRQCGPYFAITTIGRGSRILYFREGNGEGKLCLTAPSKVVVKLKKKYKYPTVKAVLIKGAGEKDVGVGVLIEISPRDYAEAKGCLPPPAR